VTVRSRCQETGETLKKVSGDEDERLAEVLMTMTARGLLR
jgi:hypothetical protein